MHYQIKYDQTGQATRSSTIKLTLKHIGITLLIVAIFWGIFWSMGMDWRVTVDALEQMAAEVSTGSSITEAFSGFCLEILQGA